MRGSRRVELTGRGLLVRPGTCLRFAPGSACQSHRRVRPRTWSRHGRSRTPQALGGRRPRPREAQQLPEVQGVVARVREVPQAVLRVAAGEVQHQGLDTELGRLRAEAELIRIRVVQHPLPPLVEDLLRAHPPAHRAAQRADDVPLVEDWLRALRVLLADAPRGEDPWRLAPVLLPSPLEDLDLGPVPGCLGPHELHNEQFPLRLGMPGPVQHLLELCLLDGVHLLVVLVHGLPRRLQLCLLGGPSLLPARCHLCGRLHALEAAQELLVVRVDLGEQVPCGHVGALVRVGVACRHAPDIGSFRHGVAALSKLLNRRGGRPPVAHLSSGGAGLGTGDVGLQ
mmetsp:Transcript_50060/g.149475  ORF Transcript_50060/g.149475 Transcript_50060/m.149475 type:complete len:340 (-) Transcript_50060:151-1170(-)